MPLPPEIRPFFWEYDVDGLSWKDSRGTIIPRLLRRGGEGGIDYLLTVMASEELRDWLVARDIRGIPPSQLRRLERLLELPDEWVEERVSRYESSVWGRRTIR